MVLEQVRRALLSLHKALVDAERVEFERVHGRISAVGFVEALTSNAAFTWLRPLTTLLVEVDELIDLEEASRRPGARPRAGEQRQDELNACLERLDKLLYPDLEAEGFSRRYAQLLQLSPDAVLAHGAVKQALA